MNKTELWQNLVSYQFDHLVPQHLWDEILAKFGAKEAPLKAFANKLHRKLGWRKTFALRAIHEYKKFVYLAVISDSGVTPSKIIDQVWHEHLLFSAGYRKFCETVIAYDLDHHPELVPLSGQTETFQTQYFRTVALYEMEFGKAPPDDIWNTTKFKQPKEDSAAWAGDSSYVYLSTGAETGTLVSMLEGSDGSSFEFGGGESGGGGAGGSWGDSGGDSSSGDSGSSSDSGGSSCSSSCSSSCGGGGGD